MHAEGLAPLTGIGAGAYSRHARGQVDARCQAQQEERRGHYRKHCACADEKQGAPSTMHDQMIVQRWLILDEIKPEP